MHNLQIDNTERVETGCGPDIIKKDFDIEEQVRKELESIDRATEEVNERVRDLCKARVKKFEERIYGATSEQQDDDIEREIESE
jgi:hypothetical protein